MAWAVVVWITGGVAFDLDHLRISSRSAARPAVLALLVLLAATWGTSAADRRALLARIRRRGDQLAPAGAVLLALGVATASAMFGGHVAGAADASGYVSQSRHWGDGRLRVPAPDLTGAPWPDAGWLVAPLGYAPSRVAGELAPTYAPGLPWLMALGAAVTGEGGRYVWTPLFAGLFVWGTFRLARREAPPLVALGAAVLAGTSPPVLFAAMQTMSDLPAAALWLGALLTIGSNRPGVTLASGTLAGLALVVRPNLVAVAAALGLASLAARLWAPGQPPDPRPPRADPRGSPLPTAAVPPAASRPSGVPPGVDRLTADAPPRFGRARRRARGAVGRARGPGGAGRRRAQHHAVGRADGVGLRRQRRPLHARQPAAQSGAPVALDHRDRRLLEPRRRDRRRLGRGGRRTKPGVAGAGPGCRRGRQLSRLRGVRGMVVSPLLPAGLAGARRGRRGGGVARSGALEPRRGGDRRGGDGAGGRRRAQSRRRPPSGPSSCGRANSATPPRPPS